MSETEAMLVEPQSGWDRSQLSRCNPTSLIRYCSVPLPHERLSSSPKPHNLFRYVHADREGEKLVRRAISMVRNHSPEAQHENTPKPAKTGSKTPGLDG
jgi:hypothetical protein